jgi:hypothetical protein
VAPLNEILIDVVSGFSRTESGCNGWFGSALRSDAVEERTLRIAFSDPRNSVSCAAIPLRIRSIL